VVAIVVGLAATLGVVPATEAQPTAAPVKVAVRKDLEEAERLSGEARKLYGEGKYAAALPLAEHALSIREKALGPDHLDVARSLHSLASLYFEMGDYARALPLSQRALTIREKALGPSHPQVARSLTGLAMTYHEMGDYPRALPLHQRALAIQEKALGPDDPDVAKSLNDLAVVYGAMGAYSRAVPLHQRALAIREKALGPDHLDVAKSLHDLAVVYGVMGDYARAVPLHQRALAIREKALGPDHPDVAESLGNFANVYHEMGDYERAVPMKRRALAILEKALGPDHPYVAEALNYLAVVYESMGDHARALPLQQRALAIREKASGPEHPDVATALTDLADVYAEIGEDAQVLPLKQRALAIREKALGPQHPDVAAVLDDIGAIYTATRDGARALPLHQRALAIREKALGPDHSYVALTLDLLAVVAEARGDLSGALPFAERAAEIREKNLVAILNTGTEKQKRAALAKIAADVNHDLWRTIHAEDPRAARLALTTLLRRKGRALDATAESVRLLRSNLGAEIQPLFDDLQAVRSQRSALLLRDPGLNPGDSYKVLLVELDAKDQALEEQLSQKSDTFRAIAQPITVAAVQAALPDDAALVEWTVFRPFNLKAGAQREKWGPPRYAACILPKHGNPARVDLGDAATIDADVQALRSAFAHPASKDVPKLARALEARVMAPVRALLGDTRRVFLSPDGQLNLIPFAALISEDGRPLIERYAFTYLTSGRDLLRRGARSSARQVPLVLTNPDFDLNAAGGPFPRLLHGTGVAATIAARFQHPAPILLAGRDATKARLQQVHGPMFLHLGSHGYYDDKVCTAQPPEGLSDQPLLRSGIALAGANGCTSGSSEGLLTASEASGLDLYGTKLAVLSACQTGTGDVKAGDGVYGLRRALVLAGAETQVMSLWNVDEAATAELMQAYYEALANGGGRSEAMRQVQLAMLRDSRREHPYYWAAFIVSGDDRSLDGKAIVPDLAVHPGGACACRMGESDVGSRPAWLAALAVLALTARPAYRRKPR
jgi:CHAT domain-containing protein/lipopolysaccharide biosynthesis regulator YciM